MAYESKPGDGVLWKNNRKERESQPDATGNVVAHRDIKKGEKLNLAAWTKEGQKGKFQSLRMSDPMEKKEEDSKEDLDDSIPF